MQNQRHKVIGLIILVIGFYCSWFAIEWSRFLNAPIIPNDKTIIYVLKPGSSIQTLAEDLSNLNLLKKPRYLVWLAYLSGDSKKLKAGEYEFVPGSTPRQLLEQIVSGKVVLHEFTIIEGWNYTQLMTALDKEPHVSHTLTGLSSDQVMKKIGVSGNFPEGRFFPDTYKFTLDTPDYVILQKAYQAMEKHLASEWQARIPGLPYKTPYDALIVASMIEKETGKSEERPMISRVLLLRMQKKMLLQIDPTVIYGMGTRYKGKITKVDLRFDTPYNTYKRHGLPPTPISMPSLMSIRAALHPASGNWLYFVSKGNGNHYFSATLAEHVKAVARYLTKPKVEVNDDSK